ncbi:MULTISPECIES: hypothetical protein [Anaerotruncus]|jgi:hypothetical protein|nr:hypothetical protein [Anaerotruncus massiliensis (ex Togo et al. 2019)]GKH47186.1 hypothetical protein CE91St45_17480 [Oscillospiraceae bacterium]
MLKKLLKYEIRATARLFLPVFGAILLLAILNNIFFNFNDIPDFAAVLTMMLYVILIIALFVLVYVVMIQRFYKNLLRDEGYLMFTLPVRTWQLIASKLIVSIMWLAICTFVTVLSVFIMAFSLDLLREIPEFLRQLSDFLAHYVGISEVTLFFEFVFLMLIGTIGSVLMIYAAISIGHLVGKHRVLTAFGAYIGLSIVEQIITNLYFSLVGRIYDHTIPYGSYGAYQFGYGAYDFAREFVGAMHMIVIPTLIITVIFSVVYFILTNYILSHRLNLE